MNQPAHTRAVSTRWLESGITFAEGLQLQEQLVIDRQEGSINDTLLLLEHAAVYTIGRTSDKSSLQEAQLLPHPVFEINRGGKATYHGPGQLTAYAILDLVPLGKDLHVYLRFLEEVLILTCQEFGVNAHRRDGLTGIWIENRKMASIGVGVRKWVSMHGIALNVTRESLPPFLSIVPCGLDGVSMTCLEVEAGRDLSVEEVGNAFARHFDTLVTAQRKQETSA
ncbi:lipoyl(octanoyl) transferase LipB [Sulfuriroseicoccus oceanibius]|uniref:Octanoyltransferase n=1 Tax=Sulfuriroseicoccus oceanibius TaxID=2707525 RepID=A0A6B3L3U5_9BACT|nr:lipoyl(octanoyl) transferase LipB [Sulfuriroseicoccus oceanibius]QQL43940.1 lipoyl(octanoyl) transferase LipB [Sulfuriroseicoccus oceanibius]